MFISLVCRILEGADASSRRAQEIVERVSDVAAALESPTADPDNFLRGMSASCKPTSRVIMFQNLNILMVDCGAKCKTLRMPRFVVKKSIKIPLLTGYRTHIPSNVLASFDKSAL